MWSYHIVHTTFEFDSNDEAVAVPEVIEIFEDLDEAERFFSDFELEPSD